MSSVIDLLLETLADLSDGELESFKEVLSKIDYHRLDFHRHYLPLMQWEIVDMQDLVYLMVLTDGQKSVEKTKRVLKIMKRPDLVQRLSNSSSGPKSKKSK